MVPSRDTNDLAYKRRVCLCARRGAAPHAASCIDFCQSPQNRREWEKLRVSAMSGACVPASAERLRVVTTGRVGGSRGGRSAIKCPPSFRPDSPQKATSNHNDAKLCAWRSYLGLYWPAVAFIPLHSHRSFSCRYPRVYHSDRSLLRLFYRHLLSPSCSHRY